eukprot:1904877-Rhodomonas_salina.1
MKLNQRPARCRLVTHAEAAPPRLILQEIRHAVAPAVDFPLRTVVCSFPPHARVPIAAADVAEVHAAVAVLDPPCTSSASDSTLSAPLSQNPFSARAKCSLSESVMSESQTRNGPWSSVPCGCMRRPCASGQHTLADNTRTPCCVSYGRRILRGHAPRGELTGTRHRLPEEQRFLNLETAKLAQSSPSPRGCVGTAHAYP